jgi:hypothetical protein
MISITLSFDEAMDVLEQLREVAPGTHASLVFNRILKELAK